MAEQEDETVFTCVVCGESIRPEQGEEFKHVKDSKTGKNLVFCKSDGTFLAQLITGSFEESDLQELRENNSFFEETVSRMSATREYFVRKEIDQVRDMVGDLLEKPDIVAANSSSSRRERRSITASTLE